jgi:opacity protein-like surface antigen
MKRIIVAIIIALCVCSAVQAAGPTISVMTEQVTNVDSGNSISVELGYYLGSDNGGLEPFIGVDWWPRWNDEGDMEPPSVVKLGVRNWFRDIVDPNSAIPFIPDLFLTVLNEDIEIRPYVATSFSSNIVDKDAGEMSLATGIAVKTSPDSNSALRFEVRYNDTFGALDVVPDNRFDAYMGIYIPF